MDRVEATCRLRGGIKHSYNEQLPGKITAMLSPEQNERITRTGPETSLGKGVRRYWVPALVADQLPEAGGDPVRVTLFNEDFVLFRAGDGTLGMLDEHCRHRGASLVLGRVEDCGIRCIYPGGKYIGRAAGRERWVQKVKTRWG